MFSGGELAKFYYGILLGALALAFLGGVVFVGLIWGAVQLFHHLHIGWN